MGRDIPKDLVENIAKGDCAIFVGAGLSIGCGIPGWNDLLKPLCEELRDLDLLAQISPLDVAQVYESRFGRQRLIQHVVTQTDSTGRKPSQNHSLLSALDAKVFITTNYDDLLEQTFGAQSQRYRKVVQDKHLPYTSQKSVTLVKLHGDIHQPETIIITRNDYLTYQCRFPLVQRKLETLVAERTLLFVGYSLRDPDFQHLQAETAFHLLSHSRKSYAVLDGVREFDRDLLASINISSVDLNNWGEGSTSERLQNFLRELSEHVRSLKEYRSSTKYILSAAQAKKLARKHRRVKDTIREIEESGYCLLKCVEFLAYCPLVDSGQYNWQSPSLPPDLVAEIDSWDGPVIAYTREDENGNRYFGFAFGTRDGDFS